MTLPRSADEIDAARALGAIPSAGFERDVEVLPKMCGIRWPELVDFA